MILIMILVMIIKLLLIERNFNEAYNDQKFVEYFNKNLIGKKEIKNSQIQDSINLMRENQLKKRAKEKEKKTELKYVKEKK